MKMWEIIKGMSESKFDIDTVFECTNVDDRLKDVFIDDDGKLKRENGDIEPMFLNYKSDWRIKIYNCYDCAIYVFNNDSGNECQGSDTVCHEFRL